MMFKRGDRWIRLEGESKVEFKQVSKAKMMRLLKNRSFGQLWIISAIQIPEQIQPQSKPSDTIQPHRSFF